MKFWNGLSIGFEHPWLLLCLFAIPVLAYVKGLRGGAPSVIFSSTATLQSLGRLAESKAGNLLAALFFASLALLIIGLARPQLGKTLTHVEASGIDIMFLIDVSSSMLTEDFTIGGQRASRLDTIKQVTQKFIENRPNDRIGIIAFGGRPYLVSPLTLDHDWLLKNMERVRIGLVEDSTAIGSAIASACNRLKSKQSKSKVIILLTDGENNAGKISPDTAAEVAKTLGIKLHAIGAGTNGEALVPNIDTKTWQKVPDMFGNYYHKEMVHFNEEGLKKVADTAGGLFYRATDTRSLQGIYNQIDKMEKSTAELSHYKQYRDLFPWFLAAGFALLAIEIVLAHTIWRKLP